MELWRTAEAEARRPKVFSGGHVAAAVVAHVVLMLLFLGVGSLAFSKTPESVEVIDLEVVVNENLDGEENQPPPLTNPEPEPPPPPKPAPKPEPEEIPEAKPDEAVEVVKAPPKKVERKPPAPKPEPPKKTARELREERKRRMLESAKTVHKPVKVQVKDAPSGNGRTERQRLSESEIRKLLNQGYRPSNRTVLATSEAQRCASLIKRALDRRWDELSPTVDLSGTVTLSAQFTDAGRLVNCRLLKSCGSAISDRAALSVASTVGIVAGLSPEFIAESRRQPVSIFYEVNGR